MEKLNQLIPHPKRPPYKPSRHSSSFAADGRAETDRYNFEKCGHRLRTVLTQFEAREVHLSWTPYDQLLAPQVSYLLLGRWSTDRPLTPCTDVRASWYVQTMPRMAPFFIVQIWATDIGRLRITSARHEEAAVPVRLKIYPPPPPLCFDMLDNMYYYPPPLTILWAKTFLVKKNV